MKKKTKIKIKKSNVMPLPTRPHIAAPRAAAGRMMHDIKILPDFFNEVEKLNKTFEIRWMDRPYEVGDTLFLREWDPVKEQYTGRSEARLITYIAIMDVKDYDGLAVMALRPV